MESESARCSGRQCVRALSSSSCRARRDSVALSLPRGLLLAVLQFLNEERDLAVAASVCREWREAAKELMFGCDVRVVHTVRVHMETRPAQFHNEVLTPLLSQKRAALLVNIMVYGEDDHLLVELPWKDDNIDPNDYGEGADVYPESHILLWILRALREAPTRFVALRVRLVTDEAYDGRPLVIGREVDRLIREAAPQLQRVSLVPYADAWTVGTSRLCAPAYCQQPT